MISLCHLVTLPLGYLPPSGSGDTPWDFLSLSRAVLCLVAQSCPTLCDPMDCSPPGSSVHEGSPGKSTGVGCPLLDRNTKQDLPCLMLQLCRIWDELHLSVQLCFSKGLTPINPISGKAHVVTRVASEAGGIGDEDKKISILLSH